MSMGESTRRRLEGVVRSAQGGPAVPGQYVGGYNGGLGGSWGKAERGISGQPGSGSARPASAGRTRPAGAGNNANPASGPGAGPITAHDVTARPSESTSGRGVRDKIRPASSGVKSVWDQAPRELPKAPPHALTSGKVRPGSATMAKTTRPLANTSLVEYKIQGMSLEPASITTPSKAYTAGQSMSGSPFTGGGGGGGGGGLGTRTSGTFGTPGPINRAVNTGNAYTPGSAAAMEQSRNQLEALRNMESTYGTSGASISEAHLAALEDAIRDAVRAQRSVYEGSKEMLLKLFRAVDDGSGDVSIPEFCKVCQQVGVSVSPEEGAALFRRFGYDTAMPYERFAHTLLTQPARQLAEDMPVRKGAFAAGGNASFTGKILYRYCRKPVYTPSDWDPSLAEKSAQLPQARLVLEFVYGYQGNENTSQNLFYTSEGKLVYYTAGVGVVYQRPPIHHQYFFLGHTDDITSLAVCRAAVDVDGRSYPERTLVATGQVTSTEEGAYVCIWDSRLARTGDGPAAVPELVRLKFDKEARGITALGFSPSGNRLAAVATDNQHTVYVYDWRKQRCLATGKGQMGDPPQVYGVEWNPYEGSGGCGPAFLTFGRKHIKCWTADPQDPGKWNSKSWSFGRHPMQNVTSAQWLPPRPGSGGECLVVAGVADGSLYVFKGSACIKSITAHRPGPQVIQADGHPAYMGVRGLRVCKQGTVLLSGGADGTVLQWDVSDGNISDARFAGPSMQLASPFGPKDKHAPCIRSIDYSPELDRIVVGTNHCDIVELTPTTAETLMDGHSGDVYGIASHPSQPHLLSTVSDSGHVHLWDTQQRKMTACAALGWTPRAVAYSPGPVLDEGNRLQPLHKCRDSKEGVHDLKYSPDGRFLAAATYDTWIDVYSVNKEYSRVARCSGHSSTVRCIDWSVDSSVLQSCSADLELLYWNARVGKQITMPQRDTQFSTWNAYLGFPVMGIFPPCADGTDINSVDRSKDNQLVATADDLGMVKLFNYPCVVEDAPHRAYRGHSSHVMGVRFNCDGSMVCSVGGRDWAIFQFRLVHIAPDAPPPAAPKPVWGPLDPQGKSFGYTTRPAVLPSPDAAPPSSMSPYTPHQQQHTTTSSLSTAATVGVTSQQPPAMNSPPPSAGGGGGGITFAVLEDVPLQGSPALSAATTQQQATPQQQQGGTGSVTSTSPSVTGRPAPGSVVPSQPLPNNPPHGTRKQGQQQGTPQSEVGGGGGRQGMSTSMMTMMMMSQQQQQQPLDVISEEASRVSQEASQPHQKQLQKPSQAYDVSTAAAGRGVGGGAGVGIGGGQRSGVTAPDVMTAYGGGAPLQRNPAPTRVYNDYEDDGDEVDDEPTVVAGDEDSDLGGHGDVSF